MLGRAVSVHRPDVVLAPAAIGGHVDHLAVREAALTLRRRGIAVVLYEDLPYACHPLVARRALEKRLAGFEPVHMFIAQQLAGKRSALALYRSQLTRADTARVSNLARERGGSFPAERIFVPRGKALGLIRLLRGAIYSPSKKPASR